MSATHTALTITLYGPRRRKVLHSIAYDFAYLSIERVATVRNAPAFPPEREAIWLQLRHTLVSALPPTFDQDEFPEVPEPEWPVKYRLDDYESYGGKIQNMPGIGRMLVGAKQRLRKGAKQAPTYVSQRTAETATRWAAEFCLLCGVE